MQPPNKHFKTPDHGLKLFLSISHSRSTTSLIVILPLTPGRQHCHDLVFLDLVQRNVSAGAEGNDDFAEEGLARVALRMASRARSASARSALSCSSKNYVMGVRPHIFPLTSKIVTYPFFCSLDPYFYSRPK